MTTIRLRFPASRYHANPWGRHVNEGVPEWPPSPYRLLRALYDVWKRKCAHLSEEVVGNLLGTLAAHEPRFALPAATASHTRSYLSSNSEDPTDKSLIFDAFLAFDRGAACYLFWPELALTDEQRRVLGELLQDLNYLGRSESWIDADVYDGAADAPYSCDPVHLSERSGEVTQVACLVSPVEYKGRRQWLDALTASSSELLKQRQSGPPLLRTVRYVRPESCIQMNPVSSAQRGEPTANAVLLGLDCIVLPLVTATIEVAEQIRVRLMGAHKRRMGYDPARVSALFSGKENGEKRLDHGHVFILPQGNKSGRIDRVLLLSNRRAFTQDELHAVGGVRRLWQREDRPEVRCVIAWQGAADDSTVRTRASSVVSTTPFVTARHWRKGRDPHDFILAEIRRECRNHDLPEPVRIELIRKVAGPQGEGLFECIEFRSNRKDDPSRAGYAFRLKFAEKVLTPFSLGYGSHFGLGQFRAV